MNFKIKLNKVQRTLCVILLTLIIQSCKSSKVVLPPLPCRTEQQVPSNKNEYVELILYYETLLQQYEAWAESVKEIIE